jgi:glycosyltransferase involved in cell wall biosynthesis
MSVYNGARYLPASLDSLIEQQGIEHEVIAVDDGSTDESGRILEEYAGRDPRIRVLRQENGGLTRALIRGCSEARGRYIARHDADDLSLPGRLKRQADYLVSNPSVRLAGCWTRCIGPEGEELYSLAREETPEDSTRQLRASSLDRLRGLGGHGSAMFRREDYLSVGGYRQQLYFAQDLDLWLRLTEHGFLGFVREFLYEWRVMPSSVSSRFRDQQRQTCRLILEMARLRPNGTEEAAVLDRAALIRPGVKKPERSLRSTARGNYFIGKCLMDRGDPRCVGYLLRSARLWPIQMRAWLALLRWSLRRVG